VLFVAGVRHLRGQKLPGVDGYDQQYEKRQEKAALRKTISAIFFISVLFLYLYNVYTNRCHYRMIAMFANCYEVVSAVLSIRYC